MQCTPLGWRQMFDLQYISCLAILGKVEDISLPTKMQSGKQT